MLRLVREVELSADGAVARNLALRVFQRNREQRVVSLCLVVVPGLRPRRVRGGLFERGGAVSESRLKRRRFARCHVRRGQLFDGVTRVVDLGPRGGHLLAQCGDGRDRCADDAADQRTSGPEHRAELRELDTRLKRGADEPGRARLPAELADESLHSGRRASEPLTQRDGRVGCLLLRARSSLGCCCELLLFGLRLRDLRREVADAACEPRDGVGERSRLLRSDVRPRCGDGDDERFGHFCRSLLAFS